MEIPHEVTARRDTGLYNAKIGVWLFLASEVMLFGGLFSAYVFLRVGTEPGVDNPWPLGMNVQKVLPGFINTLVLIASSVFVVFAWVSLKERKFQNYQRWMLAVIACAGIFMVIKYFEYKDKLTAHHDIKLVDNSILGGRILEDTGKIRFEAEQVSVDLTGWIPGFISQIAEDERKDLEFKIEGGGSVKLSQFRSWFLKERRRVNRELNQQRAARRQAIREGAEQIPGIDVETKAVLLGKFRLNADPRKVVSHDAETVNFRDRASVRGRLVDDSIKLELHAVDLQMIPLHEQDGVLAWDIIGDESVKADVLAARDLHIERIRRHYKDGAVPPEVLGGPYVSYHYLSKVRKELAKHAQESGEGDDGEDSHGHSHGHSHGESGGHDYLIVNVPRDQTTFVTNHGPRAGTYYAIYFTMTGLHGLHVIGGALVLAYFTFFGKSLYRKNPEHLANRVEVGGLFWHFVDLVWIFLFPIMYLM